MHWDYQCMPQHAIYFIPMIMYTFDLTEINSHLQWYTYIYFFIRSRISICLPFISNVSQNSNDLLWIIAACNYNLFRFLFRSFVCCISCFSLASTSINSKSRTVNHCNVSNFSKPNNEIKECCTSAQLS